MDLPELKDALNLHGKRVILRVDFNVPMSGGVIQNNHRITRIIPTIEFLQKSGAHIIILSHHSNVTQSLRPVSNYLATLFEIRFVEDVYNKEDFLFKGHEIVLCENLRFWKGEKENDTVFAEYLASLGDIYINDAFGDSHREHASIVSLPNLLPSYAGFELVLEIDQLSKTHDPKLLTLVILGGEKISTKLPLAVEFIDAVDSIFLGGALSNNFFKEKGYNIGKSIYDTTFTVPLRLKESQKIILPIDVVVKNEKGVFVKKPADVSSGDRISDAGPLTISLLKEKIDKTNLVVFNGPLGEYKHKGFEKGTIEIIKYIANRDIVSIVGGGDTAALVFDAGMDKHITFISTGGGAMLEFLAHKTLPGIEALRKRSTRAHLDDS